MSKYQNLLFALLLIFTSTLFISCEKEEMEIEENKQTVKAIITAAADSVNCFKIVYPIDVDVPGSTPVSVNSVIEFEKVIDDYFANNPGTKDEIWPIFPFNVTLGAGTNQTLAKEEDLEDLLKDCGLYE